MKKILVCQHVPYEILGTFNPLLKRAGFRIRYVNFGRHPDAEPPLEGYHGLVILGGPMNVDQEASHPHLKTEIRLIEQAIRGKLTVLGICLGAQLIAKALGAAVKKSPQKEIGWYDVTPTEKAKTDPLFRHFGATEKIFQWHGDTFDIPRGAIPLARSKTCPNQAFRFGKNVYALQFHLEVDERLVERWLKVPRHLNELKALEGRIDPETIRRDTRDHIAHLKVLSDKTFGEFIKLLGIPKKAKRLPSR